MVHTPKGEAPMYFASVQVHKLSGTAVGFWNGKEAESHAHDGLGTLTRKVACWTNTRAAVCAYATATEEKGDALDKNLACGPFTILHALASTAQLQCGFRRYGQAWLARARSCYTELGEAHADLPWRISVP